MKTLLKAAIQALSLSVLVLFANSNAMAFWVNAEALVTPNLVTVTACNSDYDSTIVCDVNATGFLNAGFPIFGNVNLVLAPGQCDNAYVYATYPYFFMNGQGTANCSFY